MEKPTGDDPVILKQLTARIDRGGQPALELKTGSYRFGNSGENRIGELKLQLSGELPASAFNEYLGGEMRFDAGKVKLSAAGSLAHDFRSAVFSGEVSFDELAAAAYGKDYRDFSAQCAIFVLYAEYAAGRVPDTEFLSAARG